MLFSFILLGMILSGSLASAEIYVYRDGGGVLHFSNVPTSTNYRSYMNESDIDSLFSLTTSSYDDVIADAARANDLSFYLIKAMVHVESCFNPYAISKKGALGLMQIMPENLKLLNIDDPFDPRENIMGGAIYLRKMMSRFHGKLELALAAYNAGPSAVEKYSAIPPFQETREYVQKVMKLYQRYRNA